MFTLTDVHPNDNNHANVVSTISMHFDGFEGSFHPDYIHQLFYDEVIQGYNLEDDDETLDIDVTMSPSCQSCSIIYTLCTSEKTNISTTVSSDTGANDPNSKTKRRVGFVLPQEATPEVKTKHKKMEIAEITEKLQRALPPIAETAIIRCTHNDALISAKRQRQELASALNVNILKDDFLIDPVGSLLKEYQRNYGDKEHYFVMCIADACEKTAQFHNLVQPLSLWFIETANCVDILDLTGSWKVIYLFEKHHFFNSGDEGETAKHEHNQEAKTRFSLAGYMTLCYFNSPFRKPVPGYVVRVCQMLILPHHQRYGHGLEMLKCLYHDVVDTTIVEINVEDPSPSFTALRNRMDYELLLQNIAICNNNKESDNTSRILPSKYTTPASNVDDASSFFLILTESESAKAGNIAKITPNQIHASYEIYKLSMVEEKLQESNNSARGEWEKQYRLMVKRRLVRTYKEELGGLQTKEERQQLLANIYQKLLNQYRNILKFRVWEAIVKDSLC